MGAALVSNLKDMKQVFEAYSRADARQAPPRHDGQGGARPVRGGEHLRLGFGVMSMLAAFVRVNIDDDLYIQADQADTSSELVFEEFEEFIARVFLQAV